VKSRTEAALSLRDLSFGFDEKLLFSDLSLELGRENPVVFLGPSGCGKTTLLRLMAGLLRPVSGTIAWGEGSEAPRCAFVFQEPRLLPWLSVLENVILPVKRLGREGEARARHFLDLVSLGEKAGAYPGELSGGQRQRVSLARAFAYPAAVLFMDEPFQFLDLPLRIELMDTTLALLNEERCLLAAVTHDPREAVYLGERIILLGRPPSGIVLDEPVTLSRKDRAYGSAASSPLEGKLMEALC
jgi:NitT/TauT family transport system ATP-binding protein